MQTDRTYALEEELRDTKTQLALLKSNLEVARRYVIQRERIIQDILSAKIDKKRKQQIQETLQSSAIDFERLLSCDPFH